jgi:ABC-type uncharacterized transport system fused permease/ATPase subunit
LLLAIDCGLGSFIAVWREWYWGSLSGHELHKWIGYIIQFSFAALFSCWISGKTQFIAGKIALTYRTKLTDIALELETFKSIEGGAQRVQEDPYTYPTLLINFIVNCIRSVIMIVSFSIIILLSLPWYFLAFPFIYAIIATLVAAKIAQPLIKLNYDNQALEARFRATLEKAVYVLVYNNCYSLLSTTKNLTYFQSFYNQVTIIVPHIMLAALYFSYAITFGVFMQLAASMVEIINNLSFLINSFNDINKLIASRKRLVEIQVI